MTITLDLPPELERQLREQLPDLDRTARESLLLDLYRQHKITHHELALALGLNRFDMDALLKSRGINYEISPEDVERESASLRETIKP